MEQNDSSSNSPSPKKQDGVNRQRMSLAEMAQIGIFVLLLLALIKYASVILIPLTLAILFSLLLAPVVNLLESLHIPKRIGAFFVVAAIVSLIITAVTMLSVPAEEWLDRSPEMLHRVEKKLNKIKKPIQQVQEAAEKVEGLTEVKEDANELVLKPKTKELFETLFSATPDLLAFLVLSIVLLYFLLFTGDILAKYLIAAIYWLARQRTSLDMGHDIQRQISRYLLTITIINLCLGTLVSIAMAVIGLPNPILWGVMAAILNYAPYLGAIVSLAIISVVSFVSFDSFSHILAAPSVFLLLTALEGQFITPQVLGNRFAINPLIVFLAIIVWGWLWGYVGALLAFPLLVIVKIVAQSVNSLNPLVDLLEDGSRFNGETEVEK